MMVYGLPLFLPQVAGPVAGGSNLITAVTRNYTELDSSLQQRIELPPITLAGDFEIKAKIATTATTGNLALIGDAISGILIDIATPFVSCWISGVEYTFNYVTTLRDGRLHQFHAVLSGTVLEVFINNVSLGTHAVTPYTGINSFVIGNFNTYNAYLDGIIADVEIYDAGTLVFSNPIDNDWVDSNIVPNLASPLGAEEVVNGTFDDGLTGWQVNNGSAITNVNAELLVERLVAGTTWPNARQTLTGLEIGQQYLLGASVLNPTGGEVYQSIEGISEATKATTALSGNLESFFIATATTHNLDVGFWAASGGVGDQVAFDNISIRKATGWGEGINLTADQAAAYTEHKEQTPVEWWNQFAPNKLLFSSDFANAVWDKGFAITVTSDAEGISDRLTVTSTAHRCRQAVSVTPGDDMVFSFLAKNETMTDAMYSIFNLTSPGDIVSATSFFSQLDNTSFSRIDVLFTVPIGCSNIYVYVLRDSPSTGDILIKSAQLSIGVTPSPLVETTDKGSRIIEVAY